LILICGTKEERRKRGERGGAENEAQNEHRRLEGLNTKNKEAMDSCQRPLVATLSII
jgi:hypothetical protein